MKMQLKMPCRVHIAIIVKIVAIVDTYKMICMEYKRAFHSKLG